MNTPPLTTAQVDAAARAAAAVYGVTLTDVVGVTKRREAVRGRELLCAWLLERGYGPSAIRRALVAAAAESPTMYPARLAAVQTISGSLHRRAVDRTMLARLDAAAGMGA
jgi:hypothetical protein